MKSAMEWLANQETVLFLGQSVKDGGTHMGKDFTGIDPDLRIEFPVAEELQMGVSIGLALEGFTPVSVYPRWNFLLLAANQLVNHLDRLPIYSAYCPKVIIRTSVGKARPLDPGPQHQDDFSAAFDAMLRTIEVETGTLKEYKAAYQSTYSTILVDPCS